MEGDLHAETFPYSLQITGLIWKMWMIHSIERDSGNSYAIVFKYELFLSQLCRVPYWSHFN